MATSNGRKSQIEGLIEVRAGSAAPLEHHIARKATGHLINIIKINLTTWLFISVATDTLAPFNGGTPRQT
jgi:hypothetical protein